MNNRERELVVCGMEIVKYLTEIKRPVNYDTFVKHVGTNLPKEGKNEKLSDSLDLLLELNIISELGDDAYGLNP